MLRELFAALCLVAAVPANAAPAKQIEVDVGGGVRIRTWTSGPITDARPTIVFIPGWRFSGSVWQAQMKGFATDYHVLTLDPRSQGASTKTAEGDTPEQRAIDLHRVLSAAGVKRFVLVAWSQGAQDAAAYILRFGTKQIAGLVIVDSAISGGVSAIGRSSASVQRQLSLMPLYLEDPRAYTEGMMRAVISKQMSPEELKGLVDTALQTPPAIGATMLMADMFGTDRTAALARIDVPTMIIASPTSPELADQKAMASRIPGAEMHVVSGAGHAVFVDRPTEFNALLAAFIRKREVDPSAPA